MIGILVMVIRVVIVIIIVIGFLEREDGRPASGRRRLTWEIYTYMMVTMLVSKTLHDLRIL